MARAYDLRPLLFGDHLSRSFSIFSSHGLAFGRWMLLSWCLPMALLVVGLNLLLDPYAHVATGKADSPGLFSASGFAAYHWLVAGAAVLLAFWTAAPGVVFMAARYYVGDDPSLTQVVRAVWRRSGSFTVATLMFVAGAGLIAALCYGPVLLMYVEDPRGSVIEVIAIAILLSTPGVLLLLGFYAGRWSLAAPAAILDDVDGVGAFARGSKLSKGFRTRLFGLVLLCAVMTGIPGLFSVVDAGGQFGRWLLADNGYPVAGDLLRLTWQALFAPLMFIALVVFYFDQRCRKEGYDIAVMARAFGIEESDMLRFQMNSDLGYTPRGWTAAPARRTALRRPVAAKLRGRI